MKPRDAVLFDIRTIAALLALIFSLAALISSYHYIYKNTPDYAFNRIITSADAKDKSAFFKAVNDKAWPFPYMIMRLKDGTETLSLPF